MNLIIGIFIGAICGFIVAGLCNAADEPNYSLVDLSYRLLVNARDTGDTDEIAIAAYKAIGYLGQALE